MSILIALTENDKRILIAVCLLFILVFVIIGYIGLLVERIMKRQAKTAGTMMHNVVAAKIVKNERQFMRLGRKKNNRLFAKQAIIPVSILAFALLIYIIYGAVTQHWLLNIFDHEKEGFGTIIYLWDFKNTPHVTWFGMSIIADWPKLLNSPHWEWSAWASYLIVPCIFVGFIWLFVATQAHIARAFRLRKLSKKVFNPSLEDTYQISNTTNNDNNAKL